jgi:peptidoglycan/LPS O-acetylase OafA/YrhL
VAQPIQRTDLKLLYNTHKTQEKGNMRVEALTFFRFFAAMIVVIYHYGQNTKLAGMFYPFITSGPQMVTFFYFVRFCINHQPLPEN